MHHLIEKSERQALQRDRGDSLRVLLNGLHLLTSVGADGVLMGVVAMIGLCIILCTACGRCSVYASPINSELQSAVVYSEQFDAIRSSRRLFQVLCKNRMIVRVC